MNSKEVFAKFVELDQEIIRLKELNREMVEALKVAGDALVHNGRGYYNNTEALQVIVPLIAKAEGESKVREKHSKPVKYVDVLFVENKAKPPCTMEFVEVENEYGESVSFGEWIEDGEYSRLRIPLDKVKGEVGE